MATKKAELDSMTVAVERKEKEDNRIMVPVFLPELPGGGDGVFLTFQLVFHSGGHGCELREHSFRLVPAFALQPPEGAADQAEGDDRPFVGVDAAGGPAHLRLGQLAGKAQGG